MPFMFLLAALGCREPALDSRKAAALVGNWKSECGLLWVISLEPDLEINVQVTGRTGEMIRYGGGTTIGRKHLISPFCRADTPTVRTFQCQITSPTGQRFSGRVEAWYLGTLIKGWDVKDMTQFETRLDLPSR
jgi:hypothetical protein